MTALKALRDDKRAGRPLTAIQQVILDAYYRGGMNVTANLAANELVDMQKRIAVGQGFDYSERNLGILQSLLDILGLSDVEEIPEAVEQLKGDTS